MAVVHYKKLAIDVDTGVPHCYGSGTSCTTSLTGDFFAVPRGDSPFFNERLAECTQKINALISEVSETNDNPKQHLELLLTVRGIVLAWVNTNLVNSDDNTEEEIAEAIGV